MSLGIGEFLSHMAKPGKFRRDGDGFPVFLEPLFARNVYRVSQPRIPLAQPMSDDDLAQVYLDARAIEDARSLQSGVVAPHAAGLRAVESAVRERLGVT